MEQPAFWDAKTQFVSDAETLTVTIAFIYGVNRMWPKRAIDWIENGTAFVSVPFTWNLPIARHRCIKLNKLGYTVRAGGPAVSLMPDYLADVAKIGGEVNALKYHNPNATFTSRGCVRNCAFCAVPKIEGRLRELDDDEWEPKPIVCDNNLLACTEGHFDQVVDRLRFIKKIDFNQGLDTRLLTNHHIEKLITLDLAFIRLAWDHSILEPTVMNALERLLKAGIPKRKIRIYVLFGFNDTPEDARYRFETLKQIGIWPSPQRYQPLDTLKKNSYVNRSLGWTNHLLNRYMRFWSRQAWLGGVNFDDYRPEDY